MATTQGDIIAELQRANAELRRERDEGLARRESEYSDRIEQQSATIDVLKVMSASPGDAQPVFELIVVRARALCGADYTRMALLDGDMLHLQAHTGLDAPRAREYEALFPRPLSASNLFGRAILAREAVQTPDLWEDADHFVTTAAGSATATGARSIIAVPLLRMGMSIGAIQLGRRRSGEFSSAQVELLKTFAEQAVIAIASAETYRALQTRTSDLQELLEYQTATSDVLKVISQSTFDLPPVLERLLRTAALLCDADLGSIAIREGDVYRMAANYNPVTPEYDAYFRDRLMPADRGSVTGRTVLEGRIIHVANVMSDPEFALTEVVKHGGARTVLGVPLLREGVVAGVIILGRKPVQPFTDRQIELVTTFADQAVIAIENTRLLTEQREALEQQTATAEVLQLINASPGNLAPVFDAMLDRAMHLCDGAQGTLWMFDGEHMCASATAGYSSELAEQLSEWREMHPFQRRLSQDDRVFQIVDLAAEELYLSGNPLTQAAVDVAGIRTVVFVALVKDSTTLGGFTIGRREVRAFTDKHVALLQNFAEQAVIAIENARLINEQREALEQQTAMAEVLQVINASPGNLVPVFDTILEKAMRLCGAAFGGLSTFDGEFFQAVATWGMSPGLAEALAKRGPVRPSSSTAYDQIARGADIAHIEDVTAGGNRFPSSPNIDQDGARTTLFVALRGDDALLGALVIFRKEVRPFSDKQIALLKNFAAQAVIAMENARLLDELRERTAALAERNSEYGERIEQQSATIDVLKVMSGSPGDPQPVFDLIAERAGTFCEADGVGVAMLDGELLHLQTHRGMQPVAGDYEALFPLPVNRGTMMGRAILARDAVRIRDTQADPDFVLKAITTVMARSLIAVPMLRSDTPIGAIALARNKPGDFTTAQVELLRIFAEQAAIAIGSAETYRALQTRTSDLQESLEYQTATSDVLKIISRSTFDLDPVFQAVVATAVRLCRADQATIYRYQDGEYRWAAGYSLAPDYEHIERAVRIRPGTGTLVGRVAPGGRTVQILDAWTDLAYEVKEDARVPRVVHIAGYNRFSFTRASAVVNCQSALACFLLRLSSQAATSSVRVCLSGMRRSRHWPDNTLSSDSAMFSQLPCLGV